MLEVERGQNRGTSTHMVCESHAEDGVYGKVTNASLGDRADLEGQMMVWVRVNTLLQGFCLTAGFVGSLLRSKSNIHILGYQNAGKSEGTPRRNQSFRYPQLVQWRSRTNERISGWHRRRERLPEAVGEQGNH